MTKMKFWALWSRDLQTFYTSYPKDTPVLYSSRRAAVAARLSGSYYGYQPVKVELSTEWGQPEKTWDGDCRENYALRDSQEGKRSV